MFLPSKSVLVGGILVSTFGAVFAGPVDKKPEDECKEVKKEVNSLQEPKTRKVATAYCSQYLDLPEITETFDVYHYSTDFNLPPETYTPYTVTTLPPGTITEYDTVTLTEVTTTSYTTLYFACPSVCSDDFSSSTVTMTALVDRPTTITKTITQSPNPLPNANPTRLSKACECLSIPLHTSTRTDDVTIVYAPTTVTGPAETWTDYQNVMLEIETRTLETGTTHITIPITIFPHFYDVTEYYDYPTYYETSTIFPATTTKAPKPTKKPPHPTPKPRTTRTHPPKPTKTKPPRKGGKGTKGGNN